MKENIHWNSDIRLNNKPLFNKRLFESGIRFVYELLETDNCHFLTLEQIAEKTGKHIHFLEYHQVLHSIPKEWRQTIKLSTEDPGKISEVNIQAFAGKSRKDIYDSLNRKKAKVPIERFEKWVEELNIDTQHLDVYDWVESFPMCFNYTTSVKLRSFEYHLRLRDVMCNQKLFAMKVIASPGCRFCEGTSETIVHMLWACPKVAQIWVEKVSVLRKRPGIHFTTTLVTSY